MRVDLKRTWPGVISYALLALALFVVWTQFEPIRIVGGSMAPTLHTGDLVLVRRGAPTAHGDIVLAREPGRSAVVHRVHAVYPDGSVRLKGDANLTADLVGIDANHVTGRVVAVMPVGAVLERWRQAAAYDTLSAQQNSRL